VIGELRVVADRQQRDRLQLAARYGFADQAHMTRVLRHDVQEPPSGMRQLLQPHPQ
jgi:AraC-like DNA-binding protein